MPNEFTTINIVQLERTHLQKLNRYRGMKKFRSYKKTLRPAKAHQQPLDHLHLLFKIGNPQHLLHRSVLEKEIFWHIPYKHHCLKKDQTDLHRYAHHFS